MAPAENLFLSMMKEADEAGKAQVEGATKPPGDLAQEIRKQTVITTSISMTTEVAEYRC